MTTPTPEQLAELLELCADCDKGLPKQRRRALYLLARAAHALVLGLVQRVELSTAEAYIAAGHETAEKLRAERDAARVEVAQLIGEHEALEELLQTTRMDAGQVVRERDALKAEVERLRKEVKEAFQAGRRSMHEQILKEWDT